MGVAATLPELSEWTLHKGVLSTPEGSFQYTGNLIR